MQMMDGKRKAGGKLGCALFSDCVTKSKVIEAFPGGH